MTQTVKMIKIKKMIKINKIKVAPQSRKTNKTKPRTLKILNKYKTKHKNKKMMYKKI